VEPSNLRPFIEQVRDHLKALPLRDRVREMIYSHFSPQCAQYKISEDDFYKHILKPAFQEAEPPPEEDNDPPNVKGTAVKLFGVTLHSLRRLGEVLFEDMERQKIYFEDVTLLKAHVDQLQDADAAMAYARLYKSEADPQKRSLKICYRLNPALPYRMNGEIYVSFKELLDACFKNRTLMNLAFKDFSEGRLHLWLHAQDPEAFSPTPGETSVASFLKLVYKFDRHYPFYLGGKQFDTPKAIVKAAQIELSLWNHLVNDCKNGTLQVWFDALGHRDWRTKLQPLIDYLPQNTKKVNNETNYAFVQQLLLVMESEAERPTIIVSEKRIDLSALTTTEMFAVPIQVSLKNAGFVRIDFQLDTTEQGLRLDKKKSSLFNLAGKTADLVNLHIDPQHLIKDRTYNVVLQITTDFENLSVPVIIKSVFPVRAYIFCLLKYALYGGIFFALSRWILSALTQETGGLSPRIVTSEIERSLPVNWPVFYWVFLAMVISMFGSYFLVRKAEKI